MSYKPDSVLPLRQLADKGGIDSHLSYAASHETAHCLLPVPPFGVTSWSCTRWGLHRPYVAVQPRELLPHDFTLTIQLYQVYPERS